ncbi:MAG: helix-turn-helix transcriptional regulator [Desulfotomaculum sp.]|nr:helix-turn-helix transcriptional regulator [Desulfotomaculum sp.]
MYKKLRQIRNEKGISAMEMANLLGLKTEAAYYKKESGIIKISLSEAKLISEKLQKPIEEIFFEDDVSFMETNELEKPTGTTG